MPEHFLSYTHMTTHDQLVGRYLGTSSMILLFIEETRTSLWCIPLSTKSTRFVGGYKKRRTNVQRWGFRFRGGEEYVLTGTHIYVFCFLILHHTLIILNVKYIATPRGVDKHVHKWITLLAHTIRTCYDVRIKVEHYYFNPLLPWIYKHQKFVDGRRRAKAFIEMSGVNSPPRRTVAKTPRQKLLRYTSSIYGSGLHYQVGLLLHFYL